MALNVCVHCTTRFAVGAEHCPQCGNADYYPEGSMAKITVHGGPSDKTLPAAPEIAGEETVEAALVEPTVESAEAKPYDEWTLNELQVECAARGLAKSGNKADLVLRLEEDDQEQPAETTDEEVSPVF